MLKKGFTEIAVAIIKRENSILVGRRPEGKAFAGKWEFPGGKIEIAELPEECLLREMQEELGAAIIIEKLFFIWEYEYKDQNSQKFQFYSYLCRILEEPKPLWHDELLWIDPKNLSEIDLLDADRKIIPFIKKKV